MSLSGIGSSRGFMPSSRSREKSISGNRDSWTILSLKRHSACTFQPQNYPEYKSFAAVHFTDKPLLRRGTWVGLCICLEEIESAAETSVFSYLLEMGGKMCLYSQSPFDSTTAGMIIQRKFRLNLMFNDNIPIHWRQNVELSTYSDRME